MHFKPGKETEGIYITNIIQLQGSALTIQNIKSSYCEISLCK